MATNQILAAAITFLDNYSHKDLVSNKIKTYIKNGYILEFDARHARYIPQHRLIWERCYNAELLPWVEIHHKNGDRIDNRIENLEPLSTSRHIGLHKIGNRNNKGKKGFWKWKIDSPGRKFTTEHKHKIAKALLGKPKSEEHKKNIEKNHWSRGR
jgi:hypothetical protein